MKKSMYCEECEDEVLFTYCGHGDWQCEKEHLTPPTDAFQEFRDESINSIGPFKIYLVGEVRTIVSGFIHEHDNRGVRVDTVEIREEGYDRFSTPMFIPWARIDYVRHMTEGEEKTYREKMGLSISK